MLHEVDTGTKVCGDGFCGPFYRRGRRLTENDQLIEQIDGTKAIISSLFAPVFVLIEPQRSCLQLCALSLRPSEDILRYFYRDNLFQSLKYVG